MNKFEFGLGFIAIIGATFVLSQVVSCTAIKDAAIQKTAQACVLQGLDNECNKPVAYVNAVQ